MDTHSVRVFKKRSKKIAGVIGHSFIKRIKHHCTDSIKQMGFWQPYMEGRITRSLLDAHALQLDNLFSDIAVEWVYVFGTPEWRAAVNRMLEATPEIVVVNMGTNDLCNIIRTGTGNPQQLAADMVAEAKYWRAHHGVETVVFMSVLRREAGYVGTPYTFTKLMGRFNDELARMTEAEPGLWLHHVEGFDCRTDGTSMPVSEWSRDKSHLGGHKDDLHFSK